MADICRPGVRRPFIQNNPVTPAGLARYNAQHGQPIIELLGVKSCRNTQRNSDPTARVDWMRRFSDFGGLNKRCTDEYDDNSSPP